ARRRLLHARALEALEGAAADPGELSQHAEAAGSFERAIRYALRAGDAARARWANVESAAHYERAQRVAREHAGILEAEALEALDLRLGRALATIGRPIEAETAILRARAAAETRRDDVAIF